MILCDLLPKASVNDLRPHLFTRHKLTRIQSGLKLTRVVFTRHFPKLNRVEPGLAVFTRQKLTWVSFNRGRTRVSLCRVNTALDSSLNGKLLNSVFNGRDSLNLFHFKSKVQHVCSWFGSHTVPPGEGLPEKYDGGGGCSKV